MCGRYGLINSGNLGQRFNAELPQHFALEDEYNVAPSFMMPTISRNSPNKVVLRKWGYVPFWSKTFSKPVINARADGITQKPYFRHAIKTQRCIVSASWFYEWSDPGGVPFMISVTDQEMFGMAGLYDTWKDAEGKEFETFCVLTCEPNMVMESLPHHRMTAILRPEEEDKWLDHSTPLDEVLKCLKPYPASKTKAVKLSSKINSPRNQGKDVIEVIE